MHVDAKGPINTKRSKLFIGGLSIKVTESILRDYLARFGKIKKLTIIKEGGISKGFGFVTFESELSAEQVTIATHCLAGKAFNCSFMLSDHNAKTLMNDQKERKLFLKGLHPEVSVTTLEQHFSRYGQVTHALINRFTDESSKGTGFILFESPMAVCFLLENPGIKHVFFGKEVRLFRCLTKKEIDEFLLKQRLASEGQLSPDEESNRRSKPRAPTRLPTKLQHSREVIMNAEYLNGSEVLKPILSSTSNSIKQIHDKRKITEEATATDSAHEKATFESFLPKKSKTAHITPLVDNRGLLEAKNATKPGAKYIYCPKCGRNKLQPLNKPKVLKSPPSNSPLCHECHHNNQQRIISMSDTSNLVFRIVLTISPPDLQSSK